MNFKYYFIALHIFQFFTLGVYKGILKKMNLKESCLIRI